VRNYAKLAILFTLLILFAASCTYTLEPRTEAKAAETEIEKVHAQGNCTLNTIKGTYIFEAQGVVVEDGEVLPYAEAGIWTLDGKGNASGVISASINGEPFARGDAFTATYEYASGCVYTVTDEFGLELELYTTPSGKTMTYFSPGFSGTQFRQ
jgi:hypothetical protein